MKEAHLVERAPTRAGRRFWYLLTATDASEEAGTRLQIETVRHRGGDRRLVDPVGKAAALARLQTWADANGWAVVGGGSTR